MTADILALLSPDSPDTWPQGILAAADLREKRANAATPGPWWNESGTIHAPIVGRPGAACHPANCQGANTDDPDADAEHIAAEASPAHALAAVRHWRGVVERHYMEPSTFPPQCGACKPMSTFDELDGAETVWVPIWPCDEIRETADEARAYLGGAA